MDTGSVDSRGRERVARSLEPQRGKKTVGVIMVVMSVAALLSILFLPSSTYLTAYEVCSGEGIPRAMVNEAITTMRNSTAPRDQKLAVFLTTFKTPRNRDGMEACGRAILWDLEREK